MIFSWFKSKRETTTQTVSQPAEKQVDTRQLKTPFEVVCLHTDAEARKKAFSELTEQQHLFDVIKQAKYPDMRLLAAEALHDEDLLKKAYQLAKQKDKAAARVLKLKVTDLDAAREQQQKTQQNLEKALSDITALAKAAWSPSYNTSYQAILMRWNQTQDYASTDDKDVFEAAQAKVQAKLDANKPKVEAPKEQQNICEQLEQFAVAIQQANLVEGQIAAVDWLAAIDAIGEQWKTSVSLVTPEEHIQHRYLAISQSVRSAVEVLRVLNKECQADDLDEAAIQRLYSALKAADWRLGEKPDFFEELSQLINEVKANNLEQAKAIDDEKGEIHKLLAGLRRAIKEGRLLPAKTMAIKLEHLIQQQDHFDTTGYEEQLAGLQEEVSKLLDWNEFATAPKYVELIDAMQTLAETEIGESKEEAEERQKAIKNLQSAWRELGRNDDAEQWQRFQDLGHTAFEPVQRYFDEQKKVRADNLKSRQKICAKLTEFLEQAIEGGDYKTLEKSMFQARRDWGQYRNVDRKDGTAVKERFDHLIQQIEKLLTPQYEANIAAKEVLITRMNDLASSPVDEHTIQQAKDLQSSWKQIGITPRKEDQALWARFNESSAKIFAAARAQREQQKAQEDALFTEAKACIDKVRALSAEDGEEQLEALRAQFNSIGLSEKRGADKVQKAFDKAVNGFEQLKAKALDAKSNEQLDKLAAMAQLCISAEANGDDSATVFEEWPETGLDNPQWQVGIEGRKTRALRKVAPTEEDTASRRMVCIKLEILLDSESPVDDKQLRMDYQLARLKQGERDTRSVVEQIQALIVEWYIAAAAEQQYAQELEQRFNELAKKAKQTNG